MKIIISPAKKMLSDTESGITPTSPVFLEKARWLHGIMSEMTFEELKKVLVCADNTVNLNMERLKRGFQASPLTPAVFAYDGIQYKYMAPAVFSEAELEYIKDHLVILSGLYGMLRAFDGVSPYRLEMQAKNIGNIKTLYDFWGEEIYKALCQNDETIINLASKEYSRTITPFCDKSKLIDCTFAEMADGKLLEKATLCKMARGSMVRFMAENNVLSPEGMKDFNALGFAYSEEHSKDNSYVFVKQ